MASSRWERCIPSSRASVGQSSTSTPATSTRASRRSATGAGRPTTSSRSQRLVGSRAARTPKATRSRSTSRTAPSPLAATASPLVAFGGEAAGGPVAPRAGVELRVVAARVCEPEQVHAGGDSRAAIDDELVGDEKLLRQSVPGGVGQILRAGNVPGDRVDRLDLAPKALGSPCVDDDETGFAQTSFELGGINGVALPRLQGELGRLDLLLAVRQGAQPGPDPAVEDCDVVVAEMAE